MAKQCMLLDDYSGSAVSGGECPPTFSESDPQDGTFSYTYYPGESEIPEAVAPNLSTRFYVIEATVDFSQAEGELQGVLTAHGGRFGGHSFYIYQGKLCYVHNWLGHKEKITCDLPSLISEATLKVEFAKAKTSTSPDKSLGGDTIYKVKMYIDNIEQDVDIIKISSDYAANFLTEYKHKIPYEFEGAKLKKVIVTVTNDVG